MSKGRIGSAITTVLLLAVVIVGALNAQLIQDKLLYYQYEPSEVVASFAADTGMSEQGKFLFYVSQPSLHGAESFKQQCGTTEMTTAILGCYDGQKIYIYNVEDPKLSGIRQTTAAHEMLHAAYKRLGTEEKQEVNRLLEAEYNKLKDNKELADRMAFYARTQPGERDNELHSIIGTEIATISGELEEYYGRYFSDRSKVVGQHQRYHSVFVQLRARADELNRLIDQIGDRIASQREAYAAEYESLQAAIARFNARANAGEFQNQAEFNRERQSLLARSSALDNLRADINNAISEYNALVAESNGISIEIDKLNRSMDSQLAPAPSL